LKQWRISYNISVALSARRDAHAVNALHHRVTRPSAMQARQNVGKPVIHILSKAAVHGRSNIVL
jgi:hypothetical protein